MTHVHFAEIDSTNAYCKSHFDALDDLCFVSASYQSAGKGRNERNWKANKGESLLFSCLVKNGPMLACGPFLSLLSSVSVSRTLEEEFDIHPSIKWPNDVYVNGRKIAGILLEGVGRECLVIGIGLNVNQTDFQGEYRIPPTSVARELGHPVDLEAFQKRVFANVEEDLRRYEDKAFFLSYFKRRDYLHGRRVSYQEEEYLAKGVDEDYALLLEKEGKTIRVISNEISLL